MQDGASFSANDTLAGELLDGITDYAIVRLDAAGMIVRGNAATDAMYGYLDGELRGQHFRLLRR